MKIRIIMATTCAALGFSMAGPVYALDVVGLTLLIRTKRTKR